VQGFHLALDLGGSLFALRHVVADLGAMVEVERDHGMDVGQPEGRMALHDFLGRRSVLEGADDGVEGHARPGDTDDAVAVRREGDRDGWGLQVQGHGNLHQGDDDAAGWTCARRGGSDGTGKPSRLRCTEPAGPCASPHPPRSCFQET
jgi:hypothetical protein